MAISDLHSARLEAIIAKAIRGNATEHACECDKCLYGDKTNPCISSIGIRQVTQQIILELKKLEAELAQNANNPGRPLSRSGSVQGAEV